MSRRKKRAALKALKKSEGTVSPGLLALWDRYWFGPVAAVRPYLLMKAVLLVLAFDVWLLQLQDGWSYGVDGFNVAHFQWLDLLQPEAMSGLFLGVQMAVGVLALVCVFTQAPLWVHILLALLYAYGWAMSMLDNYQHHYFLSLALVAFVFFPPIRADDLYPAQGKQTIPGKQEARHETRPDTVSSWAYVLLGTTVAIVYFFTAVNKMEPGWRTGAIIERLPKKTQWLTLLEGWFPSAETPGELFWQSMAVGVVAAEIFIAASYLFAVRQDGGQPRWARVFLWSALAAVFAFNGIGNEVVLDLNIGWFSYYMILFALIYFLPASLLSKAVRVFTLPSRMLENLRSLLAQTLAATPRLAAALTAIAGLVIVIFVGAAGIAIDLPGAANFGKITALVLLVILLLAWTRKAHNDAMRYLPAAGLAIGLLWITIAWSPIRFRFYESYAAHLQRRAHAEAAEEISKKAQRYLATGREEFREPKRP